MFLELPDVLIEKGLVVDQTLRTTVKWCQINFIVSVWCTLCTGKNSVCNVIAKSTGSSIVFSVKYIVQV